MKCIHSAIVALIVSLSTASVLSADIPSVATLSTRNIEDHQLIIDAFAEHVRAPIHRLVVGESDNNEALARKLMDLDPSVLLVVGDEAMRWVVEQSGLNWSTCSPKKPAHDRTTQIIHASTTATMTSCDWALPGNILPKHVERVLESLRPSSGRTAKSPRRITAFIPKAAVQPFRTETKSWQALFVVNPQHAVKLLFRLGLTSDAIWMSADTSIISAQVMQLAIAQQFRHGIPLIAGSRHFIPHGVALAMGYAPADIGQLAAKWTHQILVNQTPKVSDRHTLSAHVWVNQETLTQLNLTLSPPRGIEIHYWP